MSQNRNTKSVLPENKPTSMGNLAQSTLDLLLELDVLTVLPRAGWFFAGIDMPESVSDHCYQTAIISLFLAQSLTDDNVDMFKILKMSLLHDAAECQLTDLPQRASKHIRQAKKDAEHTIMLQLFEQLDPNTLEVVSEFEERKSLEARIVKAAHDLQNLIKALVYAKFNKGNLEEYLLDAENYDDRGIPLARELCDLVKRDLENTIAK